MVAMTHIDPALLLSALEAKREKRGALRFVNSEDAKPLTWVEVASQVGTSSATFSRLKQGQIPGPETLERIIDWLDVSADELSECSECGQHQELEGEEGPELPDGAKVFQEDGETGEGDTRTSAILGTGALSDSEDAETFRAVERVRELLQEGAVGVSVALDMDPDTMPAKDELDKAIEEERWDDVEEMLQGVQQRIRHLAIVDTAAFADARLTLDEDNFTVSGPMVFEGVWTGDMRFIPYGMVVWDSTLPIPIIWDREDGDHTGTVVGSITAAERVDGETSAARGPDVSEAQVEAVVSAASSPAADITALPAGYLADPKYSSAQPIRVTKRDENGLRRIYGTAAPRGVCHRSDMGACFQYPGDVDKSLRHFHTGAAVTLDSGETVRVGALTAGDLHLDTAHARRGVTARDANRHREDANKVLALVRAYDTPHGLDISGVVLPSVTDAELMAAMACAPSVELWPEGRGRTLVGVHLVPTPAWPVVAAAGGSAMEFSSSQGISIEMEEAEAQDASDEVIERLVRIEKALALLAAGAITDVPLPEDD